MPIHGNTGFKIGVDAGGHLVTADTRTFTPDPVREQRCLQFMKDCLPSVSTSYNLQKFTFCLKARCRLDCCMLVFESSRKASEKVFRRNLYYS